MTPTEEIAALEREKAGYVLAEKADRIEQVDAELARLHKAKSTSRREKATSAPAETTEA